MKNEKTKQKMNYNAYDSSVDAVDDEIVGIIHEAWSSYCVDGTYDDKLELCEGKHYILVRNMDRKIIHIAKNANTAKAYVPEGESVFSYSIYLLWDSIFIQLGSACVIVVD